MLNGKEVEKLIIDKGFIKDFINKKPFKRCLETGALTGAINTTMAGGTGAFENPDKIRQIARERFNYTI